MTELIMQVASMKTSRRYTRNDDDNTNDDNTNSARTYCNRKRKVTGGGGGGKDDDQLTKQFPKGWHYKITKWNDDWLEWKQTMYNGQKKIQIRKERNAAKDKKDKGEPNKAEKVAELKRQLAALE